MKNIYRIKKKLKKVLLLRETFSWMGKYSGYDRLFGELDKNSGGTIYLSVWRIVDEKIPFGLKKIIRKLTQKVAPNVFYNDQSLYAEFKIIFTCLITRIDLVHMAYIEDCCSIFHHFKRIFGVKLIGTIHQPCSWWETNQDRQEMLKSFDALIVLGNKELEFFNQHLPERVFFIPHGIDIEYFKPKLDPLVDANREARCIFCGKWMRDLDTLNKIIEKVASRDKSIHFDIIGDRSLSNTIHKRERVHFYNNISNHKLLDLYQGASLMILPLLECTANNALLEALACGLPVITNDVGAIRDYTRGEFAYIMPPGDVHGMASKIIEIVNDENKKIKMSSAARKFAVNHLSWQAVARETQSLYGKIL